MKYAGSQFQRALLLLLMMFGVLLLPGCIVPATYTTQEHRVFSLSPDDLQQYGIAFITPSSITGREQDRQSLALTFAEVLRKKYPEIKVVSLPETLGLLNRAGLLEEYKQMYVDYADTGIFRRDILNKISEETGARYLAQLNLAQFNQGAAGRFGFLGWRLLETKRATLRVFLQIWDGQKGTIAWEGYEEMNYAKDTYSEQGVSFNDIATAIAEHMVDAIPYKKRAKKTESQQATKKAPKVKPILIETD